MAEKDAVFGEVHRRLVHLGLSEEARGAVMAMVRSGAETAESEPSGGEPSGASEAHLTVLIARTFYKTALRATEALGSSSLSMLAMLFDLFVAHEQGRTISVTSLCIASGSAPTTALRQIGQLEERGFVARRGDELDGRRSWVHPTPRAMELIHSLVEEWVVVLRG